MPSIHPMFKIEALNGNHHPDFTIGAGTRQAMSEARDAGCMMALTMVDLFTAPTLVDLAKAEFARQMRMGAAGFL